MSESKISIPQITQDIRDMMVLTQIFDLDGEGFVIDVDTKKRHLLKMDDVTDDTGKEIVAFRDPMPRGDFYYLNPYAEGLGRKTPPNQLFYRSLETGLNEHLASAILYIFRMTLESKQTAKTASPIEVSSTVLRMASRKMDKDQTLFDLVDAKMLEEVEDLLYTRGRLHTFVLAYLGPMLKTELKCPVLTKADWDETIGKGIRKKTLMCFKSVIMGVLEINDKTGLAEFSEKVDGSLKLPVKLYTMLCVLRKVYLRFNELLPEIYADREDELQSAIDLENLTEIIDRIPQAYRLAKNMTMPSMSGSKVTDTKTMTTKTERTSNAVREFAPQEAPVTSSGWTDRARSSSGAREFRPPVIEDRQKSDPFAPFGGRIGSSEPRRSSAWESSSSNSDWGSRRSSSSGDFGRGLGVRDRGPDTRAPSNWGQPGSRRRW